MVPEEGRDLRVYPGAAVQLGRLKKGCCQWYMTSPVNFQVDIITLGFARVFA